MVHVPVMPDEVIELLDPELGMTVVDATVGAGGHSRRIADAVGSEGRIVAIDRDPEILDHAREALSDFSGRLDAVEGDFADLEKILDGLGISEVGGMLLDLGVSSLQLDSSEKGFSFAQDGPLDMRMSPMNPRTAARAVNQLSEKELADVIYEYGEERFSRRIAREIVKRRKRAKFETTGQLVDAILSVMPARRGRIHPATRTFMALRIWVNRELESLERVLENVENRMRPGARLVVISFHSLEDRIVKNALRDKAKKGSMKILTKKPLTASDEEMKSNPRSRSAKLRAAERTGDDGE